MIDEELLADLLIAWEERFAQGEDLPAADLCQESPELAKPLAERIAALKQMNWLGQQNKNPVASQQNIHVANKGNHDHFDLPFDRSTALNFYCGAEPIPGYRLITKMGNGAFGEVWAAFSDDKQLFAIKFFHGNLDAPNARVRAEKELEGLTKIKKVNHPSILKIHFLDVKHDTLILVTELAACSLDRLFTKIRAEFSMVQRCACALFLLQNVAEALDYLQTRYGLLHLDIKPTNLLLVRGKCKIGDFGTVFQMAPKYPLAKEVLLSVPSPNNPNDVETLRYNSHLDIPWEKGVRRDVTLLTANGVFTPYYAPPEAFQGKNSRSFDQYSLALTFCELVAGQIPFGNESSITQRMTGVMELAFLPHPLKAALEKALAPGPDERYLTCVAFINAMNTALEPLVHQDKWSHNWEGWLLNREAAPDQGLRIKFYQVRCRRGALRLRMLDPRWREFSYTEYSSCRDAA